MSESEFELGLEGLGELLRGGWGLFLEGGGVCFFTPPPLLASAVLGDLRGSSWFWEGGGGYLDV